MKRVVNLAISCVFLVVCWLRDLAVRIIGKRPIDTCVVLYYHAVSGAYRRRFEEQADHLLRLAEPVAADSAGLPVGRRCVAVTFDDAYRNVIDNALPALNARRIPATIFVVTKALGISPAWHDRSTRSSAERTVMDAAELRRLPNDLITVGSHTVSHRRLTGLSAQEAMTELSESRLFLEELLQQPVRLFSFPYGAYSKELLQCCRAAGYERVFTTLPFLAFSEPKEFVSGRVRVDPTDWWLEFRLKVLGAYRWQPYAFALKRKLAAIAFGVSPSGVEARREAE